MSTDILKGTYKFKSAESIETPFRKGQAEWDNRIGTTVAQARNWRMACVATSLTSLILAGGLIAVSLQRKVFPVVVTVDPSSGRAESLGAAGNLHYEVSEREIRYFLNQFILNVRTLPLDSVLLRRNWEAAYAYLSNSAATVLNEIAAKEALERKVGEDSTIIELISITRIGESNSFQARWKETLFKGTGGTERQILNGVFTIETRAPATEEQIMLNPLGITITAFQWNRELEGR